jgi:hypothetical protein
VAQHTPRSEEAAQSRRKSEELAARAAAAADPAERAWYLAWARAFRQLADLGDKNAAPRERRDH